MIEKCFKVVIEHYRRCRDGSKSVKKEIIYNSTLPKGLKQPRQGNIKSFAVSFMSRRTHFSALKPIITFLLFAEAF
jgi:hypothetical protein